MLTHVVARNRVPSLIISDRGPQFESSLWVGLWESLGSRVALAASQHPQTDGGTERVNRTLLEGMRKQLLRRQDQWEKDLPLFEMAINMARNETTRQIPFEVAMGRVPEVPAAMLQAELRGEKCKAKA